MGEGAHSEFRVERTALRAALEEAFELLRYRDNEAPARGPAAAAAEAALERLRRAYWEEGDWDWLDDDALLSRVLRDCYGYRAPEGITGAEADKQARQLLFPPHGR